MSLHVGLVWAGAAGAIWVGQERLLFKPAPLPPEVRLSDEPGVSERVVEVPGARLSVLELRQPDPKGVVFFLHGNSANLKEWFIDGSLAVQRIRSPLLLVHGDQDRLEQHPLTRAERGRDP